jgi:hypothetical protein
VEVEEHDDVEVEEQQGDKPKVARGGVRMAAPGQGGAWRHEICRRAMDTEVHLTEGCGSLSFFFMGIIF